MENSSIPTPITSVLVANRGEIARRVHHTARLLGMTTVAVFSDADAEAPHTREADAAVRLPGNTPAETYLRGDLVIAAAEAAGADAIHPGYGFLSENAGFARDVIDAGLTWVGPPVAAIEAMGSKIEAKKIMGEAGVPMLTDLEPADLTEDMLPVLVKASAGGGGRGMRIVRTLDSLHDEIEGAQREAKSAFGDDAVFCERYLERGRHIEVQIMADSHGTVWAVGERECSIQRRHQKVIEEAPSPLVERTPGMREALYKAARDAASAIGYTGAGTVEFLATDDGPPLRRGSRRRLHAGVGNPLGARRPRGLLELRGPPPPGNPAGQRRRAGRRRCPHRSALRPDARQGHLLRPHAR